jgi:argininosuccinate lyase
MTVEKNHSNTIEDLKKVIGNLTTKYEEATKLAESAVAYAKDLDDQLATKAGQAVEGAVGEAVTAPTAVSEELKDSLVDAMSKIDPSLAADLTEEFAQAEATDTVVDGEKLGAAVVKTLSKYVGPRPGYRDNVSSKRPATATKVASRAQGGSVNANMFNTFAQEMEQIAKR